MLPAPERKLIAGLVRTLDAELARLADMLSHCAELTATTPTAESSAAAAREIREAYTSIRYASSEEDATKTPVVPGIICVPRAIAETAKRVNRAKRALRDACTERGTTTIQVSTPRGSGTRQVSYLRALLQQTELSDLNLKAAYRTIWILPAMPSAVTFTRATTSVVRRTTAAVLAKRYSSSPKLSDDERKALKGLPGRTPLALVESSRENTRANVRFDAADGSSRWQQYVAHLPLMVARRGPATDGVPFEVRYSWLAGEQPRESRPSKLAKTPLIRAPKVYRYTREAEKAIHEGTDTDEDKRRSRRTRARSSR